MPAPNEITPQQLARLVGSPDCPMIIDVCLPEDRADDPYLVPGARCQMHTDLPAIRVAAQDSPVVIVCQKGLKLSQGVTAWLQSEGVRAEYLAGGALAWNATFPDFRLPLSAPRSTLWVTRHRPKIDRIACPWLIRRFVDPNARFLFVAPAQVEAVADRFDATPFDVEGVFWSHREDRCTFDTMLDEWNLRNEPMDRLSTVIRAADTNRHDLHPAAAGLLAVSVGLSRQYKDDQAQLEAGMALDDALYRWARDGHEEGHDWPTNKG